MRLMDGDHIGPFNLGNPGEFTMLELADVCLDFFINLLIRLPVHLLFIHLFAFLESFLLFLEFLSARSEIQTHFVVILVDSFLFCRLLRK